MRAQEQTVLNLIGGLDKVFIIPPFQRNYEWSFEQCNELFSDILLAYKTQKTHYVITSYSIHYTKLYESTAQDIGSDGFMYRCKTQWGG